MNNFDNEDIVNSNAEALIFREGWPCFREHSLVEAAVTEAAREIQVPREMAMMCAFGAMATACQQHINVQMPTGHKVPTSLMLLTIADSGERKTVTQNYFFLAINAQNDSAYRANEIALAAHRIKHQLWNVDKRLLERTYYKYASQKDEAATLTALEAITEHIKAEPKPARSDRFLYEDTTPQALVQMLYENTPNGCLLTSEANSIFSGKALGEIDKLNTLWDGSNVIVDRISRESFILQNARLTLSLMAQPSVITRFLDKRGEEARGTGFLARFLVVKPKPMAGQRTNQQLSELPRRQAFNARIRERLDSPALADRQVLRFSESAANLWHQYSRQLEKQMQENGAYYFLKDHASKLMDNTSRLAAILHTFERTSDSDIEIDRFTLEFCWSFAQNCSRHFMEHLANEPQLITDTNNLVHYLLKLAHKESSVKDIASSTRIAAHDANTRARHESPPSNLMKGAETTFKLTQVKQYGPGSLRGHAKTERLNAAIELLTKMGHISIIVGGYRFKETILLTQNEPELKNGELLTIRELPLFKEQVFWEPSRWIGLENPQGYFIPLQVK